ncbi:Flagellar motor rotation protein MotB [Olavius sp. associated proteobacterium Delta 1]|nr:Flagellar motor rotation protein MotB [Olavius sp. associated proteobacterium Delta 1]
MPTPKLLLLTGIAIFLISACVPLPQYMKIDSELKTSRSQKDELAAELKQAEDKNSRMDLELRDCEAARNKYLQDATELKGQNTYLSKINQQLLDNLKRLKLDISKKKSVIQLQGKVIQLLDDTKKTIETSLKDQIAAQEIEVVEEDDKLKVIFVDKILFDSGSAIISERGMKLLKIMAGSLKVNKDQDIVVEGHTDNIPLSAGLKKRFPSNWELSTARAAAVVWLFQEQGGIEPERLSARGYSFYRPVAPNTSEEGRHQNRRIEIILGAEQ